MSELVPCTRCGAPCLEPWAIVRESGRPTRVAQENHVDRVAQCVVERGLCKCCAAETRNASLESHVRNPALRRTVDLARDLTVPFVATGGA